MIGIYRVSLQPIVGMVFALVLGMVFALVLVTVGCDSRSSNSIPGKATPQQPLGDAGGQDGQREIGGFKTKEPASVGDRSRPVPDFLPEFVDGDLDSMAEALGTADARIEQALQQPPMSPEQLQQLNQMLRQIASFKLQVSEKLLQALPDKLQQPGWKVPDGTGTEMPVTPRLVARRETAIQGTLQALSMLSSMGDPTAPVRQVRFAEKYRADGSRNIAVDCLLVLLTRLTGRIEDGHIEETPEYIPLSDLFQTGDPNPRQALITMAKARTIVERLKYQEEEAGDGIDPVLLETLSTVSQHLSDRIDELFVQDGDSRLSSLASELQASVVLDRIDTLLTELADAGMPEVDRNVGDSNQSLSSETQAVISRWEKILDDSVPMPLQTVYVRYLATIAALRFEGSQMRPLAEATYRWLHLKKPPQESDQELLSFAARAYVRRRDSVGETLPISSRQWLKLETMGGRLFDWSEYRGRWVVLVFWDAGVEPSKWMVEKVSRQTTAHPEIVELVAVNLGDPRAAAEALEDRGVPFLSLNDPEKILSSAVGQTFLPMGVIVDPEGIVTQILYDVETAGKLPISGLDDLVGETSQGSNE